MALDINALRNAFGSGNRPQAPSNYFPFFAMNDGESSTIRFLPDLDQDNPLGFLVEKRTHQLTINGRPKTVPCLKMYGNKPCPICAVSSQYYNAGDSVNGKKYYRKIQHIGQALVLTTTVAPRNDGDEPFEGTVRLVQISPQIHKVIHEAIMSGDLEEDPSNFEFGTNFVIKKDKQGEYSTYSFSKFAKRETALDPDTIEYVKTQMKDLSTLLPAEPPLEEIEALLEAEMTGGTVATPSRQPAQPSGESDSAAEAVAALQARRAAQSAPVAEEAEDEDGDDEMADVLAQIAARKRQRV